MPPEEGRRGHEESDPALTRDDPTRRCEEDPIDDTELRSGRRPLQHPKLMAEDEDLEVLASVVSALLATADEETGEGPGDEAERDNIGRSYRDGPSANRGFRPPRPPARPRAEDHLGLRMVEVRQRLEP
jgi:hypothetical protein